MNERIQEIIVTAIRKSLHRSSDDIAQQIIDDLEANHYVIKKKKDDDGTFIKVC